MNPKSILQLQRKMLFFVIDAAESSMAQRQFRAFKRLVFDHYYQVIQPELHQELGVGKSDSNKESQAKVGAVPNEDREGGCNDT